MLRNHPPESPGPWWVVRLQTVPRIGKGKVDNP